MKIQRCYDSHVHFSAVGRLAGTLNLKGIRSFNDIDSANLKQIYFIKDWLIGFGWDENLFDDPQTIHKKSLDILFPNYPAVFTRGDGHSNLVNTEALKIAQQNKEIWSFLRESPLAVKDKNGELTGLLKEDAKFVFDSLIPNYSSDQELEFLQLAQNYFLKRGFTHIRDMTASRSQWELLLKLEQQDQLKMYIESNFTVETLNDLPRILQEMRWAQSQRTQHLRVRGAKIYFDGSLGSETALLSAPYRTSAPNCGVRLWTMSDFYQAVKSCWEENFEVSVHAIGDQGADEIVDTVLKLQSETNIKGTLNLEHAQLLSLETIKKLKKINCQAYMQPCHFLSDQKWLHSKLGDLTTRLFPWAALEEAGVKIYFGSDSPIEESSVANNLKAIEEAKIFGIPAPTSSFMSFHRHPDEAWGAGCESIFGEANELISVRAK